MIYILSLFCLYLYFIRINSLAVLSSICLVCRYLIVSLYLILGILQK